MDIHEKYQLLTRETVELSRKDRFDFEPYILKTDCWNEAHQVFPIAPLFRNIICVDAWDEKVAMARKLGHRIDKGDVTALPYSNDNFDVVIDLSTIDHVENYNKALDEYDRVLISGGYILICCWFNKTPEFQNEGNPMLDQFYFVYDFFKKDFERHFELIKTANVVDDVDDGPIQAHNVHVMGYLIGKKK